MESEHWKIDRSRVMWEVLDDEAVIVDLASGHYHAASGVALDVWLAIDAGTSSDEIVAGAIAARTDAPTDAPAQIEAFLADLVGRGLVSVCNDGDDPTGTGSPAAEHVRPNVERQPWTTPALESHDDLEDLLLLDPVHDVTAEGWPHAAPPDAAPLVP